MNQSPIFKQDDIEFLISDRYISDYFDALTKTYRIDPRISFNFLKNDVLELLRKEEITMKTFNISPQHTAEFLLLLQTKRMSGASAKRVLSEMYKTGETPSDVLTRLSLWAMTNLSAIAQQVCTNSSKMVSDYRAGKTQALQALVGQIMKETKGAADPEFAQQELLKIL
jgi:aspartyl-tRNA(Asn)/glutamyl-tRNA(Gln) amidotransferase subunit B